MANRLQHETSPYLLQHANNPVDWYPWGSEAIERARREEKPIFVSIGYSACHWCHVMEHESFENAQIARQLNDHFVAIKVDREERPDLDQIYMSAVQILTGRGGWPMSVFLTPGLHPFFGGTYWPPAPRMGMPGFDQVLSAVLDAWQHRRELVVDQARQLTERIEVLGAAEAKSNVDATLLERATAYLLRVFDGTYGGFGSAPKFPHAMDLQLLLRNWRRQPRDELRHVVQLTLDKMAAGGLYDHLGGGFARYSVDERWLVPHFEKMLYDNALLAATYLDSYLATGNADHARVLRETLDYVLRDMTDPLGGFHSTEDADSEGEEGKYYLWTPSEVRDVLGPELTERFCEVFDVTEHGNFEGQNILNVPRTLEQVARLRNWPLDELAEQMSEARRLLLARREQRVRPGKDDKIIVSWNGLMIDSLARAARALDDPRYLEAATRAAEFLHQQLWQHGRLLHSWRLGRASLAAYLDDYTTLANSLVSLYEASFDPRWIDWAFELMERVLSDFADPSGGAFFYTADDHEPLIARTKDSQDGSVPSGNAMAAQALIRLGHLGQRQDYREAAHAVLESAAGLMRQAPSAAGQMLLAVDLFLGPFYEVAIVADPADPDTRKSLRQINQRYLPRSAMALRPSGQPASPAEALAPLFRDRPAINDRPTFYVCQDTTCWEPVISDNTLALWDRMTEMVPSD
jgi:uncharacterized protein YyaL (SSP411 family)